MIRINGKILDLETVLEKLREEFASSQGGVFTVEIVARDQSIDGSRNSLDEVEQMIRPLNDVTTITKIMVKNNQKFFTL